MIIAVVLAAAVLHAGWNAIVKATPDRLGTMARASLVGVVILLAGLWWVTQPAGSSWPWLVASVIVHVFYNLGLAASYRLGDFNQTYPLARGVGPIVVAIVAATCCSRCLNAPRRGAWRDAGTAGSPRGREAPWWTVRRARGPPSGPSGSPGRRRRAARAAARRSRRGRRMPSSRCAASSHPRSNAAAVEVGGDIRGERPQAAAYEPNRPVRMRAGAPRYDDRRQPLDLGGESRIGCTGGKRAQRVAQPW